MAVGGAWVLLMGPFAIFAAPVIMAAAAGAAIANTPPAPKHYAELSRVPAAAELLREGLAAPQAADRLAGAVHAATKGGRHTVLRAPKAARASGEDDRLSVSVRGISLIAVSEEALSHPDPHVYLEVAMGTTVKVAGFSESTYTTYETWARPLSEWRRDRAALLRDEMGRAADALAAATAAILSSAPGPLAMLNVESERAREREQSREFVRALIAKGEAEEWGTIAMTWQSPAERARAEADRAAALSQPMPRVGDRWEYAYVDETSPFPRQVRVTVSRAGRDFVDESVQAGTRLSAATHGPGPSFTKGVLWMEFSPYLAAFGAIEPDGKWQNLPSGVLPVCRSPTVLCRATARVSGSQTLLTPAGSFETTLVDVRVTVDQSTGPSNLNLAGERLYTFWYAPEAKRFVRAEAKTLRGTAYDYDYTVELVAYELH
jgi:hypothetical protein